MYLWTHLHDPTSHQVARSGDDDAICPPPSEKRRSPNPSKNRVLGVGHPHSSRSSIKKGYKRGLQYSSNSSDSNNNLTHRANNQ